MKNDKTELFETMSVGKALLTMAIPTIISQLLSDGLIFISSTLIYRKVYNSLQKEA